MLGDHTWPLTPIIARYTKSPGIVYRAQRCKVHSARFKVQSARCKVQSTRCKVQDVKYSAQGIRHKLQRLAWCFKVSMAFQGWCGTLSSAQCFKVSIALQGPWGISRSMQHVMFRVAF